MLLKILSLGPFQSNCIIIMDESTQEAAVLDPGDEGDKIIELIKTKKLNVKHILHTHAHIDHIGGTHTLVDAWQPKTYLHEADLPLLQNLNQQSHMFGMSYRYPNLEITNFIHDDDTILCLTHLTAKVITTPGHSPGSVCFYFEKFISDDGTTNPLLICGDTLFRESIGRSDLWGGDHAQLLDSIKNKLFTLPENTVVIPGHGPKTTIKHEKNHNPFFS